MLQSAQQLSQSDDSLPVEQLDHGQRLSLHADVPEFEENRLVRQHARQSALGLSFCWSQEPAVFVFAQQQYFKVARLAVAYLAATDHANHPFQQPSVLDSRLSPLPRQLDYMFEST